MVQCTQSSSRWQRDTTVTPGLGEQIQFGINRKVICLPQISLCVCNKFFFSQNRLGVNYQLFSTNLLFFLVLPPFSSSSSSQSDVFRKSKLPSAVSTVRLTTLGERLCLPPYTHTHTHSHNRRTDRVRQSQTESDGVRRSQTSLCKREGECVPHQPHLQCNLQQLQLFLQQL